MVLLIVSQIDCFHANGSLLRKVPVRFQMIIFAERD